MWASLHCHTFFFSLQDGLSRPEKVAERLAECGHVAGAITDHGSVCGIPSFLKGMKKKALQAIPGCELYLCDKPSSQKDAANRPLTHLCVLAKNQAGWKSLLRALSRANGPASFYYKPRLSLDELADFAGDLIAFSGHPGSHLGDACFTDRRAAYAARTEAEARSLLRPDWESSLRSLAGRFCSVFGRENFYLEVQLVDVDNLPAAAVIASCLRHLSRKTGLPCVATADSHYLRREDAPDQRVLLCNSLQTTMKEVRSKLDAGDDVGLGAFFRSNNYHVPTLEELRALHEPAEIAATVEIAGRCSPVSVESPLMLPRFECPGGLSADEHLKALCRAGWKRKVFPVLDKAPHKKDEYVARVKEELETLTEFGLSPYFLVVEDVVRFARVGLKSRTGRGRGSAAGCLVSYLLDVTRVDPVRYGLLFTRFINRGRLSKDRVSPPDIDCDFESRVRDRVIDYLRDKYGHDKVAQMATFGRMQGRGALKDVLRAHGRLGFEEMNRVTAPIPDESQIADDLQEQQEAYDRGEEDHEPSIVRWALENRAGELSEWCSLDDRGELDGPLALDFAQAMRLEGTRRNMGKHASGVVVCPEPLDGLVPLVRDPSSDRLMVGYDMRDTEAAGLLKLDVLATTVLDRISACEELVRTGRCSEGGGICPHLASREGPS